MELDPAARTDVLHRLRRARGQIDAVVTMIESGRSCRDVVTQLAAASRALDKAGFKLIAASMRECLIREEGDAGLSPEEIEKLFISLA